MNLIKNIVRKNDIIIIIINGIGYFGVNAGVIALQLKIVKNFPNNPIIFFPYSIFSNPSKKHKYKEFSKIFANHTDFTLFTRDNISYTTALNYFKNNSVYNVPDIVTSLNTSFVQKNITRFGIGLILRRDELLMTNDDRLFIKYLAQKYFHNNSFRRDSNNFRLPKTSTRRNETIKFINFIARRQLIITDRLHGMIFAVITGTPCIVFGNSYHKVRSSYYSWFKNLEYVVFIKKMDIKKELETNIKKLMNLKNYTVFNHKFFDQYYLLMKNIIQSKIDMLKEKFK